MSPASANNRQSETRNAGTLPYVYSPSGSNRLFQTGSTARYHTANGNTQSIGTTSFTYDGFNRLATAQTAAETTTYTYNALGERIRKQNQNGLATAFHYGANGELLFERDQAGNTKEYVWLDGRPLARIDNGTTIYAYHVDHLGTPQMMTDQSGTTVWWADYEPFGKANIRAVSTVENNLRFPGQYADRETGMHYNYYRSAYNPGTGRYEEADPIGLESGVNLYLYANANPLSFTDPLGLDAYICTKPLNAMGGSGARSGPDISGNPLYHQYICVKDGKTTVCGGQDRGDNDSWPWDDSGKPSNDKFNAETCEKKDDRSCMDTCLKKAIQNPSRPPYGLFGSGTNCQEWADDAFARCLQQCKGKK